MKKLLLALLCLPLSLHAEEEKLPPLAPVKHIIVFYMENHSFDNLFGTFQGADGFMNVGATVQRDANNKPYETLPTIMNGKNPDPRFPEKLPNRPFLITKYVPADQKTGDLVHRFYQLQMQMDDGRMDKFIEASDAGGLTMGFYENKDSPLWQYAKEYTLADHFFTAGIGGSFLNHIFLVCACAPYYPNAPQELRAVLDQDGKLIKDGALTPDGYAVNTIEPSSPPHNPKIPPERLLPPQTMPTIGDRLNEKHIDWAWYSGGWRDADSGHPAQSFIFHHQPFGYFATYAQGTEERKKHLKDESDFVAAIESGNLPPVAFYKPSGEYDSHPGYSTLEPSEDHVFALVEKIEKSPLWKDSVIIITFDDAGGFFDHVAPPKTDRFGPGERVPTLVISPFAKRGFIDHTTYDTTSILKLIETKFDLKPLTKRDAEAGDLSNTLQFTDN